MLGWLGAAGEQSTGLTHSDSGTGVGWNLAQENLLPQPRCQDTDTDPKSARAEHPVGTFFMWALLSLEKFLSRGKQG